MGPWGPDPSTHKKQRNVCSATIEKENSRCP